MGANFVGGIFYGPTVLDKSKKKEALELGLQSVRWVQDVDNDKPLDHFSDDDTDNAGLYLEFISEEEVAKILDDFICEWEENPLSVGRRNPLDESMSFVAGGEITWGDPADFLELMNKAFYLGFLKVFGIS